MRCLVCNTEMVLMEAVRADPGILPGFEHRTFLCPACHDIERRLVFAGAKAPAAARGTVPGSAWGRAVEKVLSRHKALNEWAGAKRSSERTSTFEKTLRTGDNAGKERPSTARTIDLVSELNRIWDDPVPVADKLLEPPPIPLVE
jgi:hypothetical protein